MTDLRDIPTVEIQNAARAWRHHAEQSNSGLWGRMFATDMSVYDRIDDLVAEVERLRWEAFLRKSDT